MAAALCAGGLALLFSAASGWHLQYTWQAAWPIFLAVAPLSNHIDALSSLFVALIALATISISFFSPGYLQHLEKKCNLRLYWVLVFFFIIGMVGVIVAANAITFLLFWEIVALASALLIASDLASNECKRAAFIYLGATRISTTLLIGAFLWLHALSGNWDFNTWNLSHHATVIPAAMIMVALCIKGGVWPFHSWLPYAHPAAPAPVSALMSGCMIKMSIYAIIRLLIMPGLSSPILIFALLVLGVISAFWGILYALMQNDLKCLLAYSSIENMGIILIGISLSLIANYYNMPLLAALALAGALFHTINHGLFKCLLFLAAGAIDVCAHTRNLERVGGLGKKMPGTMILFTIGTLAVCSLPPLNGFSSKWLIYQSLFRLACANQSLILSGVCFVSIGVLALVSGLALACFTKATGIIFLGRSRSSDSDHATECTPFMLAGQAIPAVACVGLGVSTPWILSKLQSICSLVYANAPSVEPLYTLRMDFVAFSLVFLVTILYVFWLNGRKSEIRSYSTWDCGAGHLSGRMQGTATSFADTFAMTFAPLLQYHLTSVIGGKDRRHFPESISVETAVTQLLETRFYGPIAKFFRWLGKCMQIMQAGSVHLYLSYILFTLVALMLAGLIVQR